SAILLGAIGSGLWSHFFDPLYVTVRDWTLSIATLGIGAMKNDLYQDIAVGEFRSIAFLRFIAMLAVINTVTTVLVEVSIMKRSLAGRATDSQSPNRFESLFIPPTGRHLRYRGYQAVFCAAAIVLFVWSIRSEYVDSAIAHYRQLRSVIAVDLSP